MSGKKVASIFDKDSNNDRQDEGQAFYAGGSEHSGQQILGPTGGPNFIQNLINDARHHAEHIHSDADVSNQSLTVTLWRNGFTVGEDGELRDYVSNREFIECLRRGEVPAELSSRVQGGMIDVKLSTKESQDYEPSRQRFQVFTGEGRRLGALAPDVVGEQQQAPKQGPSMDEIRQARLARFSQKPKENK